ncbi:MAG TPA: phosphocholine cytidylyltransferase family protein [Chloroflexota bacterium]
MIRAIIIGAGRGRRLMPLTDDTPKCYAEVGGRRIIDWTLDALGAAGLCDVVFVGGYQIERIRADYPRLSFRHNRDWEHNNILASLFHAEDAMADGFVCSYADILYRPSVVRRLLDSPADVALAVDTAWRERYAARSQHPEEDAEKVRVADGRVVEIARTIPPRTAHGEYIGLARLSPAGAAHLREHHARAGLGPKAYLIELFQVLVAAGLPLQAVDTDGGYLEVDTTEDYRLAQERWR